MGLNEDVLRFLNIRDRRGLEGPSIMMQAKTERPHRGGRDDHDDDDGVTPARILKPTILTLPPTKKVRVDR